jgi:hypothetical protein
MKFRNQIKDPKILMPIAMFCLAIAVAWPKFLHPNAYIGPDWMDGLRGLLFGISIGLSICSLVLVNRRRQYRQS